MCCESESRLQPRSFSSFESDTRLRLQTTAPDSDTKVLVFLTPTPTLHVLSNPNPDCDSRVQVF